MRWRTPMVTALFACLAFVSPARSDPPAAEAEILREVGKTYAGLRRFLLEGSIRVEVRGAKSQSQDAPFLSAADGAGQLRDEVTSAAVGGMIISNGRETFIYNGQLGQYLRRPGSADSTLKQFASRGVGASLILRYEGIAMGAADAKRLADEAVTLEGARRDCIVLEVTYAPSPQAPQITQLPSHYWIDKQTHLVLRQQSLTTADQVQFGGKVEQEENVVFRRARLDPQLPDSLWVFRPPAGSREVTEFKANREEQVSSFTGKPAIDFSLKDLKGRAHTLKSLRGKTVLLDFWATWCGPCRITMPRVAKIHEEYKNRGVVVISINVGETADKAGEYMTKNGYAFTTLLDQDRSVSSRYQVNGIPTLVVIDRVGKVSDYLVGVRDEVALRAALKKAGVK